MSPTAIHVSIPLKDAYTLAGIEARLRDALKHTGCAACCSGKDIYLDMEREYLVNPAFKMAGATLASRTLDRPTNTLVFGAEEGSKIDSLLGALKNLAAVNGHPPCCSGLDISLMQFRDSMKLNVGAL